MHHTLEFLAKRGKSFVLVGALGAGSLLHSGCATGNPAFDAFMNYGVAPVVAADAGRSRQTVIVNGNSSAPRGQGETIYDNSGVSPLYLKAKRDVALMVKQNAFFRIGNKWVDLNNNGVIEAEEIENLQTSFTTRETIYLSGMNKQLPAVGWEYELRENSGKLVDSSTPVMKSTPSLGISSDYTPGKLGTGSYVATWNVHGTMVGQISFNVQESPIITNNLR
jgi:hypothetical protein